METNATLLSITIVLFVFVRSWFVAMYGTLERCESVHTCEAQTVLIDTVLAFVYGVMSLSVVFAVMWFVEVIIVGVLSKPIHGNDDDDKSIDVFKMSEGIRVLLLWVFNWRLLMAIALALFTTAVLAQAILTIIRWYIEANPQLSQTQRTRMLRRGISAIYIYSLFAVLSFVLYQLWISFSEDSNSEVVIRRCM